MISIKFNASAAKESSCLRRTWYTVIEGYTNPVPSNDIVFGSAVHEYIKHMELSKGDYSIATAAALKVFNGPKKTKSKKEYLDSPVYLLKLCQDYWDTYLVSGEWKTLQDKDGVPLVELKFEIPYLVTEGVEVSLCGTIDKMAKMHNGCYAIPDYKTTSVYDHKAYLESYRLSPQLFFYKMAVEHYAELYPDSIFATMCKTKLGCFIEGIFLGGKDKEPVFKRSDVMFFDEFKMAEFKMLLDEKIKKLVSYAEHNALPLREGMLNGSCNTIYGQCKFFNVCSAFDEITAGHVLRNNFVKQPYDPLHL